MDYAEQPFKVIDDDSVFTDGKLGRFNAVIINNLIVNVVENSFDKDYIMLDDEYYNHLKLSMNENYKNIYFNESVRKVQSSVIEPMYERMFTRLLSDLKSANKDTWIFKHHINYVNNIRNFYCDDNYLETNTPEDIVIDYIASMTDDYITELFGYLFPEEKKIEYISYF